MAQNTVGYLKTNSGKKGEGMPVVRNPQYYFKEGFCWTNVLNPQARLLKARLKEKSVNDVGSMSLFSMHKNIPNFYLIVLLNSNFLFDYYREFINCTVNIQINDIRQLPVFIPALNNLEKCHYLYEEVLHKKKNEYLRNNKIKRQNYNLIEIEAQLNDFIEKLYQIV